VTDWLLKKHSFNKDERHYVLQIFISGLYYSSGNLKKRKREVLERFS